MRSGVELVDHEANEGRRAHNAKAVLSADLEPPTSSPYPSSACISKAPSAQPGRLASERILETRLHATCQLSASTICRASEGSLTTACGERSPCPNADT